MNDQYLWFGHNWEEIYSGQKYTKAFYGHANFPFLQNGIDLSLFNILRRSMLYVLKNGGTVRNINVLIFKKLERFYYIGILVETDVPTCNRYCFFPSFKHLNRVQHCRIKKGLHHTIEIKNGNFSNIHFTDENNKHDCSSGKFSEKEPIFNFILNQIDAEEVFQTTYMGRPVTDSHMQYLNSVFNNIPFTYINLLSIPYVCNNVVLTSFFLKNKQNSYNEQSYDSTCCAKNILKDKNIRYQHNINDLHVKTYISNYRDNNLPTQHYYYGDSKPYCLEPKQFFLTKLI